MAASVLHVNFYRAARRTLHGGLHYAHACFPRGVFISGAARRATARDVYTTGAYSLYSRPWGRCSDVRSTVISRQQSSSREYPHTFF